MIYVVGIGPGAARARTAEATQAIIESDVLVGYSAYVELVKPEFPDKPTFATAMRGEAERCREAIRLAREGHRVCVICSGDAAVYGMASLILELAEPTDEVEIVPGVTAALAASAELGAPLAGDMAIISLSDLLTPWERIEKRLAAAASADFCMAIYNPSSVKRAEYLARACDVIMRWQPADIHCGWVRNIARANCEKKILTLGALRAEHVDMFTTVIIGNRSTIERNGKLITPRGYRL